MTLGGDGSTSRAIPDPAAPAAPAAPEAPAAPRPPQRVLHIWDDGFSIGDGPLRRYDDEANAADLATIRSGHAPIHLMNVPPGVHVAVRVERHAENFRVLPKKYKPFSGTGQRLGSPTPGGPSVPQPAAAPPAARVPTAMDGIGAVPGPPETFADPGQPTVSLRLQLADGTRLPARFNTTQTIGDVYEFISRSSTDAGGRAWVLATTFPNKDHTDKSAKLGDLPEFKKGGTAVQKWV